MSDARPRAAGPVDPLHVVASSAKQSAERLETVTAELAVNRSRLDALEKELQGALSAALAAAERLERLRAELLRLGQLEGSLGELRDALAREHEARHREVKADVGALQTRLQGEIDRLGRQLGQQGSRIERVEALTGRLDTLERERGAVDRAFAAVDARLDALAAERPALVEELRRSEQREQTRLDGLAAQLRALEDVVGTWRGLLEGSSETVREARQVADHMREEVGRLRQEQHALAETQRVFEGRVEGLLTAQRNAWAEEWHRFHRERAAEWAMLGRANSARDALDQDLGGRLEALSERLSTLEREVGLGQAADREALAALRHDLVTALGAWRHSLAEATERLEEAVGHGETAAAAEARRQATRRALRAGRAGRSG
jgi:chromosome segregation ATPase